MPVYVISKNGKPLMPTKPARARHLLEKGKAKVYQLDPFTIQLTVECPEIVQPIIAGLDTGASVIGLSAKSGKKILYWSKTYLRTDISQLMRQRASYRRNRRCRKVRHRRNKWFDWKLIGLTLDNREGKKETKKQLKEKAIHLEKALRRKGKYNHSKRENKKGKLPPALQSRLYWHIRAVRKLGEILPISKVRIEIANFDLQKINNPDISGTEYQQGPLFEWENKKAYVFHRDSYRCVHCKGKSGDKILEVDHIDPQSKPRSSDSVDNLITSCKTCNRERGNTPIERRPRKPFQGEATIVNVLKNRIVEEISKLYPTTVTYGHITKLKRKALGLPKEHYTDAVAIACDWGEKDIELPDDHYIHRCFSRGNYRLFKGDRSHIPNQAPKNLFGFQRWDKVYVNKNGKSALGFVKGRMSTGYFVIPDISGNVLFSSVHHRYLTKVSSFRTFSTQLARVTGNGNENNKTWQV